MTHSLDCGGYELELFGSSELIQHPGAAGTCASVNTVSLTHV